MTDLPWLLPAVRPMTFAVAVGVAALAALALAYTLRKLQSGDRIVAGGWGLGGAVAVGSGWWVSQVLALLAILPAVAYRGEALFAGWVLAVGAAFALVVLSALVPAGWKRGALVGLLLTGALTLVLRTTLATPALQPLDGRADEALLSAALVGCVPCLLAALLLTVPWSPDRAAALVRTLGGTVLLTLAIVLMQLAQLRGLRFEPAPALDAEPLLGEAGVWRLAGVGCLVLLMVLLSAVIDLRSRVHTRRLLRDAHLQLRRLAFCDPLTGLPNRLLFEERLKLALEQVGREPSGLAVLFIDLDGFKPINDSFGHAAGDEVLRQVGRRLQVLAGDQGTVARVGGDEFLLLLEQPGEHGATRLAQRALRAMSRSYSLPDGLEVSLSCSIGIALFPQHGPVAKLIANADAAMYAAKGVGGSTFAFFEPRMDMDVREQVELQRDLRLAMERGELQLYYQPKVDARSGEVTGAEALVRWSHPGRGTIAPQVFIPVAERFGLIGTLGAWVIDEACRQVREWLDEGLRMRVAVNLSVHQLRQEDLVPRIRRALAEHDVEPRLLSFEITESVAMEDTQATLRAFSQLAQLGVLLSIDDFGTGHSSLAYLRKLPARQLKIDHSFVADLEHSADALAVVDAVVRLAHALGLRVVAEGVENEAQRALLLRLRCDELQGFLIAKPMAPASLALWVMEDRPPPAGARQGGLFADTVPSPLH